MKYLFVNFPQESKKILVDSQLNSKIDFKDNVRISPVGLPKEDLKSPVEATVAGWGYTKLQKDGDDEDTEMPYPKNLQYGSQIMMNPSSSSGSSTNRSSKPDDILYAFRVLTRHCTTWDVMK